MSSTIGRISIITTKIISKSKGVGWESDPVFDDDNQNAYRQNQMWGELIRAGADIYGGRRRR